jgi:predicted dehydrogenase
MALDLTPDEKLYGKANFTEVTHDLTRRGFMKSLVVAGGAVAVAGAAGYFGYQKLGGKPVKAALIGGGDEGGVLIGEHNPEFLEFVAVCDIRPTQMRRIFEGEGATSLRKGFKFHYGKDCDKPGGTHQIRKYRDYRKMLENEKEVEAVVIATPLVSHAPIVIACLKAGKHVLCEKLMARTIRQCKEMIKAADDNDRILCIGHQRHYSLLYAHAVEVLNTGILGDVKHIRALWHRNNSWPELSGGEWRIDPKSKLPVFDGQTPMTDPVTKIPLLHDGWMKQIPKEDADALADEIRQHGYKSVEELIRWRLFNRTGGGLMAELGSHQLDACSIFLGKVHPLAVTGVGTHSLYGFPGEKDKSNPREVDDHVFCTYEFPGKNYYERDNDGKLVLRDNKPVVKDKQDVCVVTYSSISTNQFEPYGECVMGSRGTMIVETEQNAYLFTENDPMKKGGGSPKGTAASVTVASGNKPALDAGGTWGGPAQAASKAGATAAVSRGYREEMEDFAYCVKVWNDASKENRRQPRCQGRVAMADAIIALTSNLSMKQRQRIEFADDWFKAESSAIPDHDLDEELKKETV